LGFFVRFAGSRDFVESQQWKSINDVPPRALRYFDDDPQLSIYRIESLDDLPRLVAAYALAHPERLQPADCVVVAEEIIDRNSFVMQQTTGFVPDEIVATWHWELIGLTHQQALELTFRFGRYGKSVRVTLGLVKHLVRMAADGRFYDGSKLSDQMVLQAKKAGVEITGEACISCGHRKEAHDSGNGCCLICAMKR
jgi:hypothetical protein